MNPIRNALQDISNEERDAIKKHLWDCMAASSGSTEHSKADDDAWFAPSASDRIPLKVTRTERGWGGHFICANNCLFRRNTLLECGDVKIVVSTVGLMENYDKTPGKPKFRQIGCDRYFETMAFHSDPADTRYHDADVCRQVYFNAPWCIAEVDADDRANSMHEDVVAEITGRLAAGGQFPTTNTEEW